jgi:hypothetical protein
MSLAGTDSEGSPQRKTTRTTASPLLDQICHGGASVALNLTKASDVPAESKLFRCVSLNSTVIFKSPNFDRNISESKWSGTNEPRQKTGRDASDSRPSRPRSKRPIETAIYVPHDPRDLFSGGYGIYLRQRDFEALLKHHVGLDFQETSLSYEQDIAILKAIDGIPSLDPFLLKGALSFCLDRIDPSYFSISKDEEMAVREVISEKLRPIVARALRLKSSQLVNERTETFLDSLWDPEQSDAQVFLGALGISSESARSVVDGWKGIAFYRVSFEKARPGIEALLDWLASGAAEPKDRPDRARLEQQRMFRSQVREKLRTVSQQMVEVFKKYNDSHRQLMSEGRTTAFRSFLENVDRYYWVLGYCSMALRHCSSIFRRYTGLGAAARLTTEELEEMLLKINATLNSQSDGKCL